MGPPDIQNVGGMWGAVAAAVIVFAYTVWRAWVGSKRDTTDNETLQLLRDAAERWKGLHDEAWAQVKKERQLREHAELRASAITAEVELLRGEVAELQRKIEHLTALCERGGGLLPPQG